MSDPPIITKHGKKRLKGRLGLSKRAQQRHVLYVLKKGSYMYRDKQKNIFYMTWNTKEYVFGLTHTYIPILITVYHQDLSYLTKR